jgi:putative component of toxin-antitoxin plasmid stabilization module
MDLQRVLSKMLWRAAGLYFYFDRENNKIIIVVAAGEKDTQERDIRKAKEAIK